VEEVGHRDRRGPKASPERREIPAPKEIRALRGLREVHRDVRVYKEPEVNRALKARLELRVFKEMSEPRVFRVLSVFRVLKARLELRVLKEMSEPREPKEMSVLRVLKARLDLRVSKVR
jgi:hypothetical protein